MTVTGRRHVRLRAALVDDLDLHLVRAAAHPDARTRGPPMLEGRGQRLLHDAIGRQLDSGGQRRARTLPRQLHLEATRAHMLQKRVELSESGLRQPRRLVIELAQHAEQAPQLRDRLAGGVLDRAKRLPRPFGIGVQHLLRRRGLHTHQADAVRDHVVELAGDPRALLDHRLTSLLLALPLEPRRLKLEVRQLLTPAAHVPACEPASAAQEPEEEEVDEDEVTEREDVRVLCAVDERRDPSHREPDERPPPVRVRGHRVERHQGWKEHLAADRSLPRNGRLGGDRPHDDALHRQRAAPAPRERHRGEKKTYRADEPRAGDALLRQLRPDVELRVDGERAGKQDVEPDRPERRCPRQPGSHSWHASKLTPRVASRHPSGDRVRVNLRVDAPPRRTHLRMEPAWTRVPTTAGPVPTKLARRRGRQPGRPPSQQEEAT